MARLGRGLVGLIFLGGCWFINGCGGEAEPPAECRRDSDCRAFSDYCTGCDCRALAKSERDPICPGPGVQCFVDPCFNQRAVCEGGQCELAAR